MNSSETLSFAIGLSIGITFGIALLVILYQCYKSIIVVKKGTAAIVERFGRFHRKLEPGLYFLAPFSDKLRPVQWRWYETYIAGGQTNVVVHQKNLTRIELRECLFDFPVQSIITRDNVEIGVHPMLLYKLVDPLRVAYETYDLSHCLEKLVQTTLRAIIGDMGLDDTLASREEINRMMAQKLSTISLNWGVQITRVDILEIHPTPNIQMAMHKQLAAERIRRAAIVTAEGHRVKNKTEAEGVMQSRITISKGEQQVSILRAKGRGDSKKCIAAAEADAVNIIREAVSEFGVDPTQYLIGLKYIDMFRGVALNAKERKILFPFETELLGSLNGLR